MEINSDLNNITVFTLTPTEQRAAEQKTFTAHRPTSDISEIALERLQKRVKYDIQHPLNCTKENSSQSGLSSSSDEELPAGEIFVSDLVIRPTQIKTFAAPNTENPKKRKIQAINSQ